MSHELARGVPLITMRMCVNTQPCEKPTLTQIALLPGKHVKPQHCYKMPQPPPPTLLSLLTPLPSSSTIDLYNRLLEWNGEYSHRSVGLAVEQLWPNRCPRPPMPWIGEWANRLTAPPMSLAIRLISGLHLAQCITAMRKTDRNTCTHT